jgi:hypothetical protein
MISKMRRRMRLCLALFLIFHLAGCQNLYPYSEKRDKQGQDAKTAWAKFDPAAIINEQRTNLDKILAAQLETDAQFSQSLRRSNFRVLLAPQPKANPGDKEEPQNLGAAIDEELADLLGPGLQRKVLEDYEKRRGSSNTVNKELAARRFKQLQIEMPECKGAKYDLDKETIDEPKALDTLLNAAEKDAKERPKDEAAQTFLVVLRSAVGQWVKGCENEKINPLPYQALLKEIKGGKLVEAAAVMEGDAKAISDAGATARVLKLSYDAAKAEYDKLVNGADAKGGNTQASPAAGTDKPGTAPAAKGADGAAAKPADKPAAKPAGGAADATKATDGKELCPPVDTTQLKGVAAQAATAAQRLCQAVAALDKANNAFGKRFISEERLNKLQTLVDNINAAKPGEPLPDDASKLTAAYALLPALIDEINAAIAAKRKPIAMSFLIQRDIDKLKLDAANREIAILEKRAKLSAAVVTGMLDAVKMLWKAKKTWEDMVTPALRAKPLIEALQTTDAKAKIPLISAVTDYGDAASRLSLKWQQDRYRWLATHHEIGLMHSEINLKQWGSLIGTTVQQVGDASAGGQKAETYINLINAIGLFYIGHGVNK